MKLLQILSSLPVLAVLSVTVIFATASSTAMADQQHRNRNSVFNSGFNSDFNSGFNNNTVSRHIQNKRYNTSVASTFRSSSSWNRQNNRNSNRNAFRNNSYGTYFNQHQSNAYRHDNNWSVSLNFGGGYYGANNLPYGPGLSSAASRFRARQYSPVNTHTRVIYNQPTVVYVNNNSGNPGHVITRSSERRNESSLLRDINGFCFERSYDSRGLETRIQLPDSACNF